MSIRGKIQGRQKTRLYEKTVMDFATGEDGCFFAVSHDNSFLKTLRGTLTKELGINVNRVRTMGDEALFLREIKDPMYKDKKILLLVERILKGENTTGFIRQIKATYEHMYIIALTTEVEKNALALLYEIGVNNFITKPVSVDTLIEKIAFTIKPQGKIGQFIDQGKAYLAKKNFENALRVSEKILKEIKPGSAAALMIRGDAFKGQGKMEEAVSAYLEAYEGAPMYMEPLKKLAALYQELGNTEERLAYLEKLDRLSPLNVERKMDMGEIHAGFGSREKAKKLFGQAVKQATAEAMGMIEEVKRSIAERCMDKDPEISEDFYRSIIDSKRGALQKKDIETFNRLGMALRKQGKWEAAIAEYKKALEVSPKDENLFFNMALAYGDGGKHPRAVEAIQKILKLNPNFHKSSAGLSLNMGIIYYNAGEVEKARTFLEKALALDPDNQGAKKMLQGLAGREE